MESLQLRLLLPIVESVEIFGNKSITYIYHLIIYIMNNPLLITINPVFS